MAKRLLAVALLALAAVALMGTVALADDAEERTRGLGRVTAIEGETITVRTLRGTREIQTDGKTQFRVPGVENPSIADIEVGDTVAGVVVRDDEGNLLARLIAVVPRRLRGLGRVTAVHGKTITVVNLRGTFEVRTDADTRFRVPGVEDPSVKDITVGDVVAGVVVRDEKEDLLAKLVVVLPRRVRRLGEVTDVQGKTITVENPRGTFQIRTDADTRFRVPGVEDPSIKDIVVGDRIAGIIVRQDGGAPGEFLARLIAVIPQEETAAP